jgi:hypothetical protein
MTIEQVAESIGYSRVHLQKEMKKQGESPLQQLLLARYGRTLQNVSRESAHPDKEDKAYKEKYIKLLEEQLAHANEIAKVSLSDIATTQRLIAAQVKTVLQLKAEDRSQGNQKKQVQELDKINRQVANNFSVVMQKDM